HCFYGSLQMGDLVLELFDFSRIRWFRGSGKMVVKQASYVVSLAFLLKFCCDASGSLPAVSESDEPPPIERAGVLPPNHDGQRFQKRWDSRAQQEWSANSNWLE